MGCVDHDTAHQGMPKIGTNDTKFYRQLQKQYATATLQAALKRHVVTRCDDPRHTSRTNTPGEAPVLCYQYCHNHPRNVKCWGTRAEYFDRILAQHGRNKRGRAWGRSGER